MAELKLKVAAFDYIGIFAGSRASHGLDALGGMVASQMRK